MNALFSPASLMILESLSFTTTVYAFDFDGTLAPIASTPSSARLPERTEALLRSLARLTEVAVISGRSLADLKERVTPPLSYLVGNHGLEGLGLPKDAGQEAFRSAEEWRQTLTRMRAPGVEIEDKEYSIALHYRRSRNKHQARNAIRETIARLNPPPRVLEGKAVFNLVADGTPHKGLALLEIMRKAGARHALYVGDDDTDEDVFALPASNIMTVRVGHRKSSRARYFIERQSQINRVLELLVHFKSGGRLSKGSR